jgi:hypothetical protein
MSPPPRSAGLSGYTEETRPPGRPPGPGKSSEIQFPPASRSRLWSGENLVTQKKGGIFHTPLLFFGGAEGDRTPDLMNAIHARSQLRHSPVTCTIVSIED